MIPMKIRIIFCSMTVLLAGLASAGQVVLRSQGFVNATSKGMGLSANWLGIDSLPENLVDHKGIVEASASFRSSSEEVWTAHSRATAVWTVEFVPDYVGEEPSEFGVLVTLQARASGFATASDLAGQNPLRLDVSGQGLEWMAATPTAQETTSYSNGWEVETHLRTVFAEFESVGGRWLATVKDESAGNLAFKVDRIGTSLGLSDSWAKGFAVRQEQIVSIGNLSINPLWDKTTH